jgi:quinol monooxygenase YgiN
MAEVVVVGSFTARPGNELEAEEAFRALVAPTHAEDGCIIYALHRGVDDPRRLTFIERWASRQALDAHLASPTSRMSLPAPRSCSATAERSLSMSRCPTARRARDPWQRTRRAKRTLASAGPFLLGGAPATDELGQSQDAGETLGFVMKQSPACAAPERGRGQKRSPETTPNGSAADDSSVAKGGAGWGRRRHVLGGCESGARRCRCRR